MPRATAPTRSKLRVGVMGGLMRRASIGDDVVQNRPVARSERFELPTLGIEIRCSIQLSYERIGLFDVQTPGSDEATPFRHVAGCSHLAANFSIPPGGRRNGTVPLGGCFRRLVRVLFGRFF